MSMNIQERTIQFIAEQYKSNSQMILVLRDLLGISQSAVYKRIKGDQPFTLAELEILIDYHDIPSEEILTARKKKIEFGFPPLTEQNFRKDQFLTLVMEELQRLSMAKKARVIYTSIDVPFFYYFMHKELAWFKIFCFKHGVSSKNISQIPKISFTAIKKKDEQIFSTVTRLYSQIDSFEIWTSRALKLTADEILYFHNARLFSNPDDVIVLLEKLLLLADQLFGIISQNNKGRMLGKNQWGAKLDLSYNDFSRFTSVIIGESSKRTNLFLTYSMPNFLQNTDEHFIKYSIDWIKKLKRKAQPLSTAGELEQLAFIDSSKSYILKIKSEIEEEI